MRRKRERRAGRFEEEAGLSMTPMIDVVFQLLIYFLLTFSVVDLLANLDISHPKLGKPMEKVPNIGTMIRIEVLPEAYRINQRRVSEAGLRDLLGRLAQISTNQTVMVSCSPVSKHGELIAALDACAQSGFSQVSVMSGAR